MLTRPEGKGRSWLLLTLIIPFIVLLWPPFYNFKDPELFGFPFFYWYQLLWIIISSLLMAVIYLLKA